MCSQVRSVAKQMPAGLSEPGPITNAIYFTSGCPNLPPYASHGEQARKEFKRRFRSETPRIQKVIWKDVEKRVFFRLTRIMQVGIALCPTHPEESWSPASQIALRDQIGVAEKHAEDWRGS